MAESPDPSGQPLVDLIEVIGRLRRECPWKSQQTHRSLTRYLLEEAAEAVEALDAEDSARVCDELGDVLLQVYLHAAIAAEAGRFDIDDVARGLREKMIRRNPHVFAGEPAADAEAVNARWQQIKEQERAAGEERSLLLDGVPVELPALVRATKLLERMERAEQVLPPLSDSLGDRLLGLVVEAREQGVDPEQALRDVIRRLGE